MIWHHPKYYKELKRIAKEEADKRASEQANKQESEQASSDQASDEEASKQRWMCSQSLIAREGVSRWSASRPGSEELLYNFIHLREGICTSIKLRFVRVRWNNLWCGLKLILLPLATLSSTIKKPHLSWYPNRSGTPKDAQDSSLVHWIWGVFFFNSFHNLLSRTIVHWLLSYVQL